jgi:8-oxo-dGTP pyrophosphatase MutT (NUDIX family)
MRALTRLTLRVSVTSFQACRRAYWFFSRPQVFGAHAAVLTDRGTVVLVKTTYRKGWSLPGGGNKPNEEARSALLRELREEIGLIRHGEVEHVGEIHCSPDFRQAITQVFVVRAAAYSPPPWSLEIEEIREFESGGLPLDLYDEAPAQLRLAGLLP